MAGGRKIIAIEGGADDDAANAGAVRLGKRLASDALLEEADTGAVVAAAGEDLADGGWPIAPPPTDRMAVWDDDDDTAPPLQREWLGLAIGGALIAAWTIAFVMGELAIFEQAQPISVWTALVSAWSGPVLVVLVALMLLRRNSRREAARFGDAAQLLRIESQQLERRLAAVNTELSLARDFLAAQGRDLESLGRLAVERISSNAGQLQALIASNGAQVDRIGTVSDHALENMEKLRGQLPVIANSAKDVTNTIANAGRTAHGQLEDLVAGFQRLNEFGQASERQVGTVRAKVDAALAAFEESTARITELSEQRFAALEEGTQAHRQRLDAEEIAALAAIRSRAETLHEELARQREAIIRSEEDTLAALGARFAAMRAESGAFSRSLSSAEDTALRQFAERSETQLADLRLALEALGSDHEALISASRDRLAAFEANAADLTRRLAEDATLLDEQLAARRANLEVASAEQRAALTQSLADLDTAIRERRAAMAAAGAEAAEALASKLADLDTAVEAQRQRQLEEARALGQQCEAIAAQVAGFSATLKLSGEAGDAAATTIDRALAALNQHLVDMRQALNGTDGQIGTLTDSAVRLLELIQAGSEHAGTALPAALGKAEAGLGAIESRVDQMRAALGEAGEAGRTLSQDVESTRSGLKAAMVDAARMQKTLAAQAAEQEARLGELRALLAAARDDSEALSQDIDGQLSGAIVRVLQGRGAELVARLEEAIDSAAAASRETAIQMRDQLAKVDELAGNLENRVARARERAEEQIDNDFARRTALITESLNSASIDIAKVLSADVSETAWASYLRGDRGIFTRRAVSLLESSEARAVQQHYETDTEFRGHVNRYIHDFEAMLRQLLSTRDGHALGVTLLSSDMGKLYVALAQGIERLRT
ncbi:hypothetical protein [Novosphingobium sp.]|uniref:hypothetical protein n=1 Tax=Novosphingobium sp. TaxID=1874826 RepID=UPI001D949ADF|nr:hypothetical protein [Novosphingobium sp.]MBX9664640.1 hypothetical protein [Novosphingobium sp.]